MTKNCVKFEYAETLTIADFSASFRSKMTKGLADSVETLSTEYLISHEFADFFHSNDSCQSFFVSLSQPIDPNIARLTSLCSS